MGGLTYPAKIEEIDKELTMVVEEFDRAVDVEALRVAKKNGTGSLFRSGEPILRNLCRTRLFARAA